MKKIISIVLVLILLLSTSACSVSEASCFDYKLSNGNARIIAYTGEKTEVVIPAKLNQLEVTELDPAVFGKSQLLTQVTLPGSIKAVEARTFVDCSSLKTVIFVFCKHKLAKVANRFWRMLHLQNGESCNGLISHF